MAPAKHLPLTTFTRTPLPTEHATCCRLPGLLLQGASQGGVLLGGDGRWTGDALADRVAGMEKPVKCASPFVASGGAVCAATRQRRYAASQKRRRSEPCGRPTAESVR